MKSYLKENGDLVYAYGNNYKLHAMHFITYGINEKRITSSNFNIDAYIAYNGDLQYAYGTQYKKYYLHYLQYGKKEGRRAM